MAKVKFKAACRRVSEAQYKSYSILTRTARKLSFLHHMSGANASYRNEMKTGTMLQPSSLCYAVPSLKRIHFYEARQSAYEAFCGIAAKYEAPQMRYEAKPFQASCFFYRPRYSERLFELKTSEFRGEIKF